MPFQEGNQLAANARRWRTAIDKALENKSKALGQEALVKIAEQLLIKAEDGDMAALKELGDRLDGKPAQTQILQGDENNPVAIKDANRPTISKEEWLKVHGL